MKLPCSLIIGGVTWKVILDKKTSGGSFYWHEHIIKIDKSYDYERRFQVLIHEICEIIMVNNMMRWNKVTGGVGNGNYLFSFDHDRFEIFTDELAGVMRQIKKC